MVKYDLGHSLSGTKRTTPLLVERHRAWPGMFLVGASQYNILYGEPL